MDFDAAQPLRVDGLEELLPRYGHAMTRAELFEMLPDVDEDGRRALVSFQDFLKVLEFQAKRVVALGDEPRPGTPGSTASTGSAGSPGCDHMDILAAFQSLEAEDDPGFVSADDIAAIMRSAGLSLTPEEILKMGEGVGIEHSKAEGSADKM